MHNFLEQGKDMAWIADHYHINIPLTWALCLEGKTDQERFEEVEGDARAEIALRNSWAHVADILEERVAKSLGQFQQGTHQKKKFKIYARSARAFPMTWSAESSDHFGKIKADLERKGKLIEDFDIAIAAIAMAHKCGVITANQTHLKRVKNIESQSWQ